MFAPTDFTFNLNEQSMAESFSSCSSNSPYASNASDISAVWESANTTPVSSPQRRGSCRSSGKLEDGYSAMTPSYSLENYGNVNELCAMPSMARDFMASFNDPSSIMFPGSEKLVGNQTLLDYVHFTTYNSPLLSSFESTHDIPALGMDLPTPTSVASSISEDFVDPSQTTFMNTFDMQSPFRPKLHFDLGYSRASDFDANFAFDNSPQGMKCFPSPYNKPKPILSTPTRSSPLRQLYIEPLATSAALHRIQSQCSPIKQENQSPDMQGQKLRRRREARECRREAKECIFPSHIRYQEKAGKPCLWTGCNRKFRRQEHLKRHEKTHTHTDIFTCPFCFKNFGRTDNLKSHILLHSTKGKKSSRTQYFPDALQFYERLNKKNRKNNVSSLKTENGESVVKRSRVEGY